MKFEWLEVEQWQAEVAAPRQVWGLYLVDAGTYRRLFGTLTKLNRAWRIYDPGTADKYWLDNDLSLDEAQRAAKLFLCVGRPT